MDTAAVWVGVLMKQFHDFEGKMNHPGFSVTVLVCAIRGDIRMEFHDYAVMQGTSPADLDDFYLAPTDLRKLADLFSTAAKATGGYAV
jgi:hypothetical protein